MQSHCQLSTMADWDEGADDQEDPQDENGEEDILGGDEGGVEEEEEDILDMEDEAPQQSDVLLMRFCPNDSSMLYPRVSKKP